jgi:two-component system, OmpR family, sensor kinase
MGVSPVGGRSGPLILRLYAIAILTAVVIAGSWFAAHSFIQTKWKAESDLIGEILRNVPDRWAQGDLPEMLDRIAPFMSVSVYDTRGGLVATNVEPPFPFPTPDERRQAEAGAVQPRGHAIVNRVLRGSTLIGYQVLTPKFAAPPLRGVVMDLAIISSWICIVGLLMWRTLVSPLQKIAAAARSFGEGHMAARTGVDRPDEIGQVARAFDEMSERIARSREAERELLASMSHELRTPLARIRVALDLAAEGDAATARASLADVTEDLTEMETLMSSIFSTTRMEMAAAARDGQPVPLQRSDVDFPVLVEKAVAHQRACHPGRTYMVNLRTCPTVRWILADAILVRRAIENLLENAHKYSPEGVPVTVDVSEEARSFQVAVIDRGFGIDARDLPRIFTPFFRADRSRARATGGVGLGLALAKRVIEAHSGHIAVTSQLDVGTTVTFTLPIVRRPSEQRSTAVQ